MATDLPTAGLEGKIMRTEAQRLAQRAYNALCTAAGDLIRAERALRQSEKDAVPVLEDAYSLAVNARIKLAKFSHPEAAALYEQVSAELPSPPPGAEA